jgi:hypothetical protein
MSGFNPLFTSQTLQFESKPVDPVLVPISNITDAKFGILNLTAVSTPLSDRTQEFVFMVDCSGSMSDGCADGRTKMQHIVHTIKNMLLYFKENSAEIYLISLPSIFSFAFSGDPSIMESVEKSKPILLLGGGVYLFLVFLSWLFLEEKKYAFLVENFIQT